MRRLTISGQYAEDGKARRHNARAEAGHRCIRCGHPFETGKHGKGEWSPCDEQCTHGGPLRLNLYREGTFSKSVKQLLKSGFTVEAQWRILTVHHFDGNKSNDHWSNCLPLCQRCHLTIQSRVNPDIPYFFEHSAWAKPYIAAYYAHKYEGRFITRQEAEERMDELLAYELNGGIYLRKPAGGGTSSE